MIRPAGKLWCWSRSAKEPTRFCSIHVLYHLVDAWDVVTAGWTKEEQGVGRYPRRIAANEPGTQLTFKFNGTTIGFYYLAAADSGDIEWSFDGSAWKRAST